MNRKKSEEEWMETLPHPLASVLWLYIQESRVEKRVEHLLNFF